MSRSSRGLMRLSAPVAALLAVPAAALPVEPPQPYTPQWDMIWEEDFEGSGPFANLGFTGAIPGYTAGGPC